METAPAQARWPTWRTARSEQMLFLAAFSFVAGVIHTEASVEHFDPNPLYGAFFALLAGFQFGWGTWVFGRGSPRVLRLGAAVSAGVIAVWIVSRTVGVPVGPEAWSRESVGALDVGATLDELAIIALVGWTLRPDGTGFAGRDGLRLAAMALLTLTLLAGMLGVGHAH